MAHRNQTRSERSYSLEFPARLASWVAENGDLIDSLLILRELGSEASEAVEAVGDIRRVTNLRLSMELWVALVEGDGDDAERLICKHVPIHVLDRVRVALWGSPWNDDGRHLRLVG
jgi:hypothetical protein